MNSEILKKIACSADVKSLRKEDLPQLCTELRTEIIDKVSKTGGHLASSLGAVEITVAIHRVYDTAVDRVLFDVGHQCYAHKMLTGRRDQFDDLRRLDGISGFPKPYESKDDPCIAGHASVAVSNALGIARARSLRGEDYGVCVVLGDGALTGGTAYEALSDCGASGEPIVVILNDNAMSISPSVGGIARLLSRHRVRQSYINFKKLYRRTIGKYEHLYRFLHKVKERVKDFFLPDNMFEDMGFYYLGPIDGHDIRTLTRTIRYAREQNVPVLVHALTEKGKGYAPAENDPASYHGVGPFDPGTGSVSPQKDSFSSVFGDALSALARKDASVVAITAAMTEGTGLKPFSQEFPARFFDVGIAEEHAVSLAAGMATGGLRPVVAVYSTFLQRAYDMLIEDVSISSLPVVFAVDRAGLVGADGETHHGAFDVGFLRQVPGLRIFAPSSFAELRSMLSEALSAEGPCALRYSRGGEGVYRDDSSGNTESVLREGDSVTIVSYGIMINEALHAAELLSSDGISACVLKLNRLDGCVFPLVSASVAKTGKLLVVEDTAESGCIGSVLFSGLERLGIPASCSLCNLGRGIVAQGTVAQLMDRCGIDANAIAAEAKKL